MHVCVYVLCSLQCVCEDMPSYTEDDSLDAFVVCILLLCPTVVLNP